MIRPRFIPCLLLDGNGLYKTHQFKDPKYVGDPINAVRIFNEKEVDELILLDISATRQERQPNFQLIAEIASECFMPLCYGGGIRTMNDIHQMFRLGVEKVAINSAAYDDPQLVTSAADAFGSQSIVGSIDAKKTLLGGTSVYSKSAQVNRRRTPVQWATELEQLGAGEILLTSVNREGTKKGFDVELTRNVAQSVNIPVIANGGAGTPEDLADPVGGGAAAAAAGTLFVFHGKHRAVLISYPSPDEIDSLVEGTSAVASQAA